MRKIGKGRDGEVFRVQKKVPKVVREENTRSLSVFLEFCWSIPVQAVIKESFRIDTISQLCIICGVEFRLLYRGLHTIKCSNGVIHEINIPCTKIDHN